NVVQRIIDWCTDQIAKLGAELRGDKDAAFLVDMRRMYENALRSAQSGKESGTEQYTFGGVNAETRNVETLAAAERMEQTGTDAESIRKGTGWFRGIDGKWRFEIDDSAMEYFRAGDARFRRDHAEYAEHQDLTSKMMTGELTPDEENRLRELDEVWGRERARLSARVDAGNATLENLIRHDALFAAYPELRDVKVRFADLESGENGSYDRRSNTITIDRSLRNAPERTLVHEIQHAVQAIEGFTPGASAENPNYRNVAGEIEARDAAGRRNLTAEQRKTAAPNLGDEDTVLAGDENPFSYLRDSETLSIKEQINERADELNAMDPVAKVKVPENMKNKREAAKWAIQLLAHTGYRVDRFGYGEIYFDKSDIDKGMRYADTPAEKAAIAALPQVLKRGIEIGTHRDHKGRKKQTVTFSAPVELNGVRGNMAVVINKNGNHYYAHRIILPNGGIFAFSDANQKDTTRELYQGVTVSGSLADTTSVVPMRSISATDRKSNPQNAIGRNFQELSDDVFEELTRSEPPEAEDRSVMERLRQKDLDEYWEEVERLADAVADEDDANMDPNPDPEDLVQTDVQREKVPLREKVEDVRSFIARKFFD
ncbi:MAG: hypothetical protein IKC50_05425, partial [Oscillospiraceae bacterium]|nr:hypothetical protein [Oscillospiraceae bacterium]